MFSSLSLSACAVCSPFYGQKSAKPAKPRKAKNDKVAVPLPDAYSGVANNNKITDALGLATEDLYCADPTSILPDGICGT